MNKVISCCKQQFNLRLCCVFLINFFYIPLQWVSASGTETLFSQNWVRVVFNCVCLVSPVSYMDQTLRLCLQSKASALCCIFKLTWCCVRLISCPIAATLWSPQTTSRFSCWAHFSALYTNTKRMNYAIQCHTEDSVISITRINHTTLPGFIAVQDFGMDAVYPGGKNWNSFYKDFVLSHNSIN